MDEREESLTGPWGRVAREPVAPVQPLLTPSLSPQSGTVVFYGKRWTLLGIVLRGYLLTLLTAGIYRFWLTTRKRRFYWSNTVIDGHPLEYTGRSIQLLVGFLLAVLIFIPLYGGLFYVTTANPDLAAVSYLGLFVLLYFLAGYAAFRGRRFRLTRTLWRGIRFGQSGSAWGYAFRRFGWIILMGVTLGLVYPLMLASLYRYRFANTWFGDRQFSFTGRARSIAGPYFLAYVLNAIALAAASVITSLYPWPRVAGEYVPSAQSLWAWGIAGTVLAVSIVWFRAVERNRMFSCVEIGDAKLTVALRARSLFGQYLAYGVLVSLLSFGFLLALGLAIGQAETGAFDGLIESAAMFGRGLGTLVGIALAYLCVVAAYALLWEIIISFGYWKLLARSASIANIDSLATVRAQGGESPNLGEGLADALNVGAY